jgi:hypothetical protein
MFMNVIWLSVFIGAACMVAGIALVNVAQSPPGAYAGMGLVGIGFVVLLIALLVGSAKAHDDNHGGISDPAIQQWYQSLMQPDNPTASCCGEADAYWADEIHVRDGKTLATITDDRDDAPLGRPHVDNGTEIEIPKHKLKWDRGNPTGHGVVFLSRQGFVFCYVQPGGA